MNSTWKIRPFFEPEDFAGVASEEIIAQEQDWRAEAGKKTHPRRRPEPSKKRRATRSSGRAVDGGVVPSGSSPLRGTGERDEQPSVRLRLRG